MILNLIDKQSGDTVTRLWARMNVLRRNDPEANALHLGYRDVKAMTLAFSHVPERAISNFDLAFEQADALRQSYQRLRSEIMRAQWFITDLDTYTHRVIVHQTACVVVASAQASPPLDAMDRILSQLAAFNTFAFTAIDGKKYLIFCAI